MYLFKEKKSLRNYLSKWRQKNKTIGYVPTMGALHSGHLELIKSSVEKDRVTLVSIFVNPTQFNEKEDFKKYPIQIDKDILKLEALGDVILYLPEVKDIYPSGTADLEHYDFGALEKIAEGAHRPGHFQGVGQVLSRFLEIIQPDRMYMGEKDYQQLLITRKLVELLGLEIDIVGVPIKRASDGLALSSRNSRLSKDARKRVSIISESLKYIAENKQKFPLAQMLGMAAEAMEEKGCKVEYLTLANVETLQPEKAFENYPQILIVAVWLEGVRLIDNRVIGR